MKTMINKTIWLLFIAVAVASCSKDDDCDPEDENSPCYVGVSSGDRLLLTEEKTNGKTEMRFEYNEQNQVVVRHVHGVEGSLTTEHFTYNGNKMIKLERKTNGQFVMSEAYTYGAGDRPVSATWTDSDVVANVLYEYVNNTVIEKVYTPEGGININSYTFDSNGENLLKAEITAGGLLLSTIEYGDYDDKHYRYTAYPWSWKSRSLNNARSQKLKAMGVEGGEISRDDIWKYTYNAAGYPTKAEVYDKASNTLIETREFTYKKAN
ncbi:hypothetical protein SAMN05660841_03146 [Sphingobacterium nematocida]|uniref:YD repeat-containing protein n=1 Tax=Sphingobacterium nematocida TaxID=1513896 RepID=A0A1T5FBW6_9SPHI|nr:hypothetical protein [Sphingobacterium nematocida]SKB93586.1 hypothetical protein SAMN05660841_03146 [Sphingobacterium nematocida]